MRLSLQILFFVISSSVFQIAAHQIRLLLPREERVRNAIFLHDFVSKCAQALMKGYPEL